MTFIEALDALGRVNTQEAIDAMKGADKFHLRWKVKLIARTLNHCAEAATFQTKGNIDEIEGLG